MVFSLPAAAAAVAAAAVAAAAIDGSLPAAATVVGVLCLAWSPGRVPYRR